MIIILSVNPGYGQLPEMQQCGNKVAVSNDQLQFITPPNKQSDYPNQLWFMLV